MSGIVSCLDTQITFDNYFGYEMVKKFFYVYNSFKEYVVSPRSGDLSATTDGLLNKDQFLLIPWECVWINCRSWCFNELGSSLLSLLQSSTETSSFTWKFLFCCLNVWTLTILKIIPTRWVVDMINKLNVLVSSFQMGAWNQSWRFWKCSKSSNGHIPGTKGGKTFTGCQPREHKHPVFRFTSTDSKFATALQVTAMDRYYARDIKVVLRRLWRLVLKRLIWQTLSTLALTFSVTCVVQTLTASSIKTGRRKLERVYAQLLQKRLEKIGVLCIIQRTRVFFRQLLWVPFLHQST